VTLLNYYLKKAWILFNTDWCLFRFSVFTFSSDFHATLEGGLGLNDSWRYREFPLCDSSRAMHNARCDCTSFRESVLFSPNEISRRDTRTTCFRRSIRDRLVPSRCILIPRERNGRYTKRNEIPLGFSSRGFEHERARIARQKPETFDRSAARLDALFRVSIAVVITGGIARSFSSYIRTFVRGRSIVGVQ